MTLMKNKNQKKKTATEVEAKSAVPEPTPEPTPTPAAPDPAPEAPPKTARQRKLREANYIYSGTRVSFDDPGDYVEGHFANYGPALIKDQETGEPKTVAKLVLVREDKWNDGKYNPSDTLVMFPGSDLKSRVEYALGIKLDLETGEVTSEVSTAEIAPGTFMRVTYMEDVEIPGRPAPVKRYKVELEE